MHTMAASASSTKAWAKGRGMKRTHVRVDPWLPAHACCPPTMSRARSRWVSPCSGDSDGEICSEMKPVVAFEEGISVDVAEEAVAQR
jgi:hypothetical protein